jgi:Lon protease-like protein
MRNRFTHPFSDLPDVLPVFPLPGAVILPNGQLPLNIFEDRYLSMVFDAMAGSRLIGMVQPKGEVQAQHPELHETGCAGRIVSFSETRDDRLLIILAGVCRFDILGEVEMKNGYRRIQASWGRFAHDLDAQESGLDAAEIIASAKRFTESRNLSVDWSALDHLQLPELIDTLASSLPFSPEEKQGLVEAVVMGDRAELLRALCEFGAATPEDGSPVSH